jgi:hypothetical protein
MTWLAWQAAVAAMAAAVFSGIGAHDENDHKVHT